jgi:hypothetical protein
MKGSVAFESRYSRQELDMMIRTAFAELRSRKSAARDQARKEHRPFVPALLASLGCLSLSSTAGAAPFQQYANGVCHPAVPLCEIAFATVPAGKRLEIDNVSCYLRVNGGHEINSMYVYADEKLFFLAPEAVAVRDGLSGGAAAITSKTTSYAANHSIFAYANAGDHFATGIMLTNGVIGQFACHIGGQLVDG